MSENGQERPRQQSDEGEGRVPRASAVLAVETVFEVMLKSLVRGDRIELRGFGVFLVKNRKRGIGRNPKRPQEDIELPH